MASQVAAFAIYEPTSLVANQYPNNLININTSKLGAYTPQPCYLLRYMSAGNYVVNETLTFDPNDPLIDANTLTGLWVETGGDGQKGVMIDCGVTYWNGTSVVTTVSPIEAFLMVANDTTNTFALIGAYFGNTGSPSNSLPAFTTPSLSVYKISRQDDGTASATDQIVTDYTTRYVGNVVKVSQSGTPNVSVYQFSSFVPVNAIAPPINKTLFPLATPTLDMVTPAVSYANFTGTHGVAYTISPIIQNNFSGATWAITSGATGYSIDSATGIVSLSTSTTAGTHNITITITNSVDVTTVILHTVLLS